MTCSTLSGDVGHERAARSPDCDDLLDQRGVVLEDAPVAHVEQHPESSDLAFDRRTDVPEGVELDLAGVPVAGEILGLEAIELSERIAGQELSWELSEEARRGDHRWWISDLDEFRADYPAWGIRYGIEEILREIYELNVERWAATAAT
jgi:hypothetical protein